MELNSLLQKLLKKKSYSHKHSCIVCKSSKLNPFPNINVSDYGEPIYKDVLLCLDCETMFYIDNGQLIKRFNR